MHCADFASSRAILRVSQVLKARGWKEVEPDDTWDFFYADVGRGLHSSTDQLNVSALYGVGGPHRGCVAHVKGVLGGV